METYSLLREFADSWVLLAMFTFFLAVAIWAFLPSQNAARADARMIPFRNDDPLRAPKDGCSQSCATCGCNAQGAAMKGKSHV